MRETRAGLSRKELLAVLAAHPRGRDGGYGPEVRAAAASYGLACREAGQTWETLARGLPVSSTAIRRWMREASPAAPRGALVEVVSDSEAPPPAAPPMLSLVSPGGYRLEGLDVETALLLLRSLG